MKKNISNLIIIDLIVFSIIGGIIVIQKQVKEQNQIRKQNKEFYNNLYSDFLRNLETRDRIGDFDEYEKVKEENTLRYENEKGQPQVVCGTIIPPEDTDLGNKLSMRLNDKTPPNKLNRTYADEQMHFAFEKAEPGEYEIILFETSVCPGLRLENLTIEEDQIIPEVMLKLEQASIKVTVKDTSGKFVEHAQVLVGKSSGGTNSNLFTWRKGLSDSKGNFVAKNLTDGKYVVTVHTQRKNGSITIPLNKDEEKEVDITLTHNNY